MDYKKDFVTRKRVKDGCAVYYPDWSPKYPVNRYLISRSVPSRPGIFRLFYEEGPGRARLFYMERVWYGGLRAEIRRASDPSEVSDPARRAVLREHKCFYSYTIVETKADMRDLLHAYSERFLPAAEPPLSSGRYEKIMLMD